MEIEGTKWSIIHPSVSFAGPDKAKDIMTRRSNMDTTEILWITKAPVYSVSAETIYNPRTYILYFLN